MSIDGESFLLKGRGIETCDCGASPCPNGKLNNPIGKSLMPPEKSINVDEILKERGSRYGDFRDNAATAQNLKFEMKKGKRFHELNCSQREALEMIQHKIARIINGDPNYADSWVYIAGYAQLVADELEKN